MPALEMSLVEAMRHLSGKHHNENFLEDTILNSDINRVRHLFYFLKAKGREIEITYMQERYSARISQISEDELTLTLSGFKEGAIRRCRLRFEAYKELYQFEVPILLIATDQIVVKTPSFIQSVQRRVYPRIRPDDLFMKFIIYWRPLLGMTGPDFFSESRYPQIIMELRKDLPNLYLLNRIFSEEIQKISPTFRLKIYSKDDPGGESLMEKVMRSTGKSVYIKDVGKIENYYENMVHDKLVNYRGVYLKLLKEDSEENRADEYFKELHNKERNEFLSSYVCVPLRIYSRIAGYLYVYTTALEKNILSYEQALRLELLCRLMSYAMSKSVISRYYYANPVTRVVDIGLSGLLFELRDEELYKYTIDNSFIKMEIPLRQRTLKLMGEITRYFPSEKVYNVGVRFLESAPDDWRYLEEYVYNVSKSEESRISF